MAHVNVGAHCSRAVPGDLWDLFNLSVESPEASIRTAASNELLDGLQTHRGAAADLLLTMLRRSSMNAKMWGYASTLHGELDRQQIPYDVFDRAVTSSERYLPLLHRYFELNAKHWDWRC